MMKAYKTSAFASQKCDYKVIHERNSQDPVRSPKLYTGLYDRKKWFFFAITIFVNTGIKNDIYNHFKQFIFIYN